jgi:hypothetical protein
VAIVIDIYIYNYATNSEVRDAKRRMNFFQFA